MSLPKWITPAGHIGTVSELEYYQYPLDAYDESGGEFTYILLSGKLPLGLQINPAGIIQGIPVSDVNAKSGTVTYRFTVRAKNLDTGLLADRSFSISIVDVAPPTILPKNVDLGTVLDGTVIDIQLIAIEPLPGAKLTWSLFRGTIPDGLTLSSDGHLTGYIHPVPMPGYGQHPEWDASPYNYLGWDFTSRAIAKAFAFTVQVSNGVTTDTSEYKIYVFPRSFLTADNDVFTVQTQYIAGGTGQTIRYTIDIGNRHTPVILTTQSDFEAVRQGSYFSVKIDALDLDSDTLQYYIPELQTGGFDEQQLYGEITYFPDEVVDNKLDIYIDAAVDITTTPYRPNTVIKFIGISGHWQYGTINDHLTLVLSGNVALSAAPGDYITQSISGANAVIESIGATTSILELYGETTEGNIKIAGTQHSGILSVSSPLSANIGNYITQPITGANALVTANVVNSKAIPIYQTGINFNYGFGAVSINSIPTSVHPMERVLDKVYITAAAGNYITQPSTGANARVTRSTINSETVQVQFLSGAFNPAAGAGNISINGTSIDAQPIAIHQTIIPQALVTSIGNYITQPSTGANARVISDVGADTSIPVEYVLGSGIFNVGSGNIQLNGANVSMYPINAIRHTPINAIYQPGSTGFFNLQASDPAEIALINNINVSLYPTLITSVSLTPGALTTEGTVGFGVSEFDQGSLLLPSGLNIDVNTGWITGHIPYQSINQVDYIFRVLVNKKDYPGYDNKVIYKLTVLGDLNNRINWITRPDLGTIENGEISDLFVNAVSTKGKTLSYKIVSGSASRLPQGLQLTSDGLLAGRVSFELFSFDRNVLTLDKGTTFFDNVYTFTVIASDADQTIAATETFTVRIVKRTSTPYEDLYLKAMLSYDERYQLQDILSDRSVFPPNLIYRKSDPNFGVANSLKTLFLAGLTPSTLAEYVSSADANHFNKRLLLGNVRTAVARDANFNIKYEVVYVDVIDENTANGKGPSSTINMTGQITPYYEHAGTSYTVARPNSFSNMKEKMSALGYTNKGALPAWMTSRQPDGRVLGFTRAVVLAYTIPGASALIAYRFNQANQSLNQFDFTVDRYLLDNHYSDNFDVVNNEFLASKETIFDRYIKPGGVYNNVGTVDYAVMFTPFEEINDRNLSYIIQNGGIDGITHIKDGQTLVFFTQEFNNSQIDTASYNTGWAQVMTLWDREPWAYDSNTSDDPLIGIDPTPGQQWDKSSYVPGYYEHSANTAIVNQRIGIWKIEILSGDVVHLVFVQSLNYYDMLHVRSGSVNANIFYDPTVKLGNQIPNFSVISQMIKDKELTIFDGNGTRFFDLRDKYSLPEEGAKYIIWTHKTVFN